MLFSKVDFLSFSFQNLIKIDSLQGLQNLVKLQLDNNGITKIENLEHLTNLTWLDLSFNKILNIEGLQTLTRLQDLSLFHNEISEINGLDALVDLNVFSIGSNNIQKLDNVMYLRRFKNLRAVNLAGNPICKEHDYRTYVLAHLKSLTYLDYRRVHPTDVTSAREQHQDEMIELEERDEQRLAEEVAAAEHQQHCRLLEEANLGGVEDLIDKMTKENPEWDKLCQVPGLLDGWPEARDKITLAVEDLKLTMLDQHQRKQGEYDEWHYAVAQLLSEQDTVAKEHLAAFEKYKKVALMEKNNMQPAQLEEVVMNLKVALMELKDALMEIEMHSRQAVADFCQEFDRNYAELAESNKVVLTGFFTQVRDYESLFSRQLTATCVQMIEKYNNDMLDMELLSEEACNMLQDRDQMNNTIQTCQDVHTGHIDVLEDKLINQEMTRATDLMAGNATWEATRGRERVSEIIHYVERTMMELDELVEGEEQDN